MTAFRVPGVLAVVHAEDWLAAILQFWWLAKRAVVCVFRSERSNTLGFSSAGSRESQALPR
jgi:hypothetical protein